MNESTQLDPGHDLVRRDLAHVWHPCTQMQDHEWLPMVPIERGDGVWLIGHDGRRYIDAISSWWVNLFGHAEPSIGAAIKAQVDRLEQVIFAGFTHQPAIELAEELVRVTPAGLTRVFFADNGSAAVEVALKMSFHYWRNAGRAGRHKFVALSGSYHGETLGALSVTDVALYRQTYAPLLLEPLLAPSPDAYLAEPGQSAEDRARHCAAALDTLLAEHADQVCALILEPLVQCAGGMRMYDPLYLQLAREICNRHQVHLIADEIAVGFGRTGTLFACEQAAITPDLLCLSKGLTGGFLPLSAVLTTDHLYQAFYADYASQRAFLHSHSYSGNPLACAAARATLRIFRQRPVLEENRALAQVMARAADPLRDHPNVADVRQRGVILAIEMVADRRSRQAYDWRERRGLTVYRHALDNGVLLRPLGNVVYCMPPYVARPEHIERIFAVAREGIDLATRQGT